jgi:hypothetical protein
MGFKLAWPKKGLPYLLFLGVRILVRKKTQTEGDI